MQKESNSLVKLPWDSDFFGYGVGKVKLSMASETAIEDLKYHANLKNIRLIYFFIAPDDKKSQDAAINAGSVLYDRKRTYCRKPIFPVSLDQQVQSYPQAVSAEPLLHLSLQSGIHSRFKLDNNFRNQEFEKLYQAWMENSVKRLIANEVLVYQESGTNLGMITLSIKDSKVDIGLLAVDENARGKKIGAKLVSSADYYCNLWKCEAIQVITQGNNVPACLFYEKIGFTKKNEEYIYHLWL